MKVALTYYPMYIKWNHGSAVLAAILHNSGIDTEIIPLYEGFTGDGFDWVVCSFVTVHDYKKSLPIVRGITAKKVAGGIYARKGSVIEGFDYVCRGEGELLPSFFLNGDTAVFDHHHIDTDINIFPDLSGISGHEFGRGVPFLEGYKMIPYGNSRGCPFKCSFCETRNFDQVVRIKNTVRADLLRLAHEHDPDMFYFLDETLPYYSNDWMMQLAGCPRPFLCFIRADIAPPRLEYLISQGMIACAIGVESGSEWHRNIDLKKGVFDGEIYRTVRILDRHNVDRLMLYMRNTPGETDEMREMTFDMVDKLGGYAMIHEYEVL